MTRLLLLLLLLAACSPQPLVAQAAPEVSIQWTAGHRSAILTWRGLTTGQCVELQNPGGPSARLTDACTPSGTLLLSIHGRDAAYAVRGGSLVFVRDVGDQGRVVAGALLPMLEIRLPVVTQ